MKVKLTKDRMTGNNQVKVYNKPTRGYRVVAKKGAVLDMSDTSAKKLIDAGLAVATDEPESREALA